METSEWDRHVNQIKAIKQYVIAKCPACAFFVLQGTYRFASDPYVARTDGSSITFGARFFSSPPLEQTAILVHTTLHVALNHLERAKQANSQNDLALWNVCADAILNEAIAKMGWLMLPTDAVRLKDILTYEELKERPAAMWTTEILIEHLRHSRNALPAKAVSNPFPSPREQRIQERKRYAESLKTRLLHFERDLWESSEKIAPRQEPAWSVYWERAKAEDRPGGLMREIHDFSLDAVLWQSQLRYRMPQDFLEYDVQELLKQVPKRRLSGLEILSIVRMSIRTVGGLYSLANGVVDICDSLETFQQVCLIILEFDQFHAPLPGEELQTYAFERLLEKAERYAILNQLILTPEYRAYRARVPAFTTLAQSLSGIR